MIAGVGIDIIEVNRVAEKIGRENGFRENVFSTKEITYCESQTDKAQHYAARFACKEAFLKATGQGLLLGTTLKDIEVVSNDQGKPEVLLHATFKEAAQKNSWNKIHVSLTHVQAMACAVVIIEQ
jgi:holo-[acyl-carrier protein] synthase